MILLGSIYSESLSDISGVSIYPIISLAIFFIVFMWMLVWVFTRKKQYLEEGRYAPLD